MAYEYFQKLLIFVSSKVDLVFLNELTTSKAILALEMQVRDK